MLDIILCALIKFVNLLLFFFFNWWVDLLTWVLGILPDADFSADPIEWGSFGNTIGYFIPIDTMLKHFTLIMGAYVVFLSVRHVLKMIRFIR